MELASHLIESWACSTTASSCPCARASATLTTSQWDEGLDGKPADPWQHHQYLVLQDTSTSELFTFVTSYVTGRRAVGNLLRHFNRRRRPTPDDLPVVRLAHRRLSA